MCYKYWYLVHLLGSLSFETTWTCSQISTQMQQVRSLRWVYSKPSPNLQPPLCTTCIHMEATIVWMWYIVVVVLGLVMVRFWVYLPKPLNFDATQNRSPPNILMRFNMTTPLDLQTRLLAIPGWKHIYNARVRQPDQIWRLRCLSRSWVWVSWSQLSCNEKCKCFA